MLKGKMIHPQIMAALAMCGHGDKVLIADGNYPLDSKTSEAELLALAKRIAADDSVRYCPHGRPVAMWLSKNQLEKFFGRSGS